MYKTLGEARKKEAELKRLSRAEKLKLIAPPRGST
jgi:predicted GIY-YIG superfamily endonuclease